MVNLKPGCLPVIKNENLGLSGTFRGAFSRTAGTLIPEIERERELARTLKGVVYTTNFNR